jgi:GTP-binding protein HflX
VELAQLRYILPRLKGLGGVLSRLGGGIGTRGPGEKMLETDRRHIIKRIAKLKDRLKTIKSHRDRIRAKRGREILGAVAGYTNAGKSTLINLLAGDDLFVEDRLFATLDSYTRSVYIDDATKVLLTDTVGFIRNLPANLVESFRSTLEEISYADFIIHVIDISSGQIEINIKTVDEEIMKLDASDKPRILFFNKSDLAGEETLNLISGKYRDAVIGSGRTGKGISELKRAISELACTLK